MRTISFAAVMVLAALGVSPAPAQAAPAGGADAGEAIASIDFVDGPFSLTRDGEKVAASGIGDDVYDGDLIATGAGATATLKLGSASGMSGTVTLQPNTSMYFGVDVLKGERQGQVELIAGQIGLKLKKLAGNPVFTVSVESEVCAVRGTEFDVLSSAEGSILVACSEGEVACDVEGQTSSAVPGQAVEKREGEKLARRAFAPADYASFKKTWAEGETAAFARNAPRAAKLIAARYLALAEKLAANHDKIAASGALKSWLQEEKGVRPRAGGRTALPDAELRARVAELGPLLADSRVILASMERLAARTAALEEIVGSDPAVTSQLVRPGVTVGDFFKRFEAAKDSDQKRIVVLRKAIRLQKRAMREMEIRKLGR
jgi:hypothetical protein